MEVDQKAVSKRIQSIMQKLSLNQKQLAEQLGITQPTVSLYLSDRIPPAYIILRLAQISGKTMEWILTGDIEMMVDKISEPQSSYDTRLRLEKKISLLPEEISRNLEELVDKSFVRKIKKKKL